MKKVLQAWALIQNDVLMIFLFIMHLLTHFCRKKRKLLTIFSAQNITDIALLVSLPVP